MESDGQEVLEAMHGRWPGGWVMLQEMQHMKSNNHPYRNVLISASDFRTSRKDGSAGGDGDGDGGTGGGAFGEGRGGVTQWGGNWNNREPHLCK